MATTVGPMASTSGDIMGWVILAAKIFIVLGLQVILLCAVILNLPNSIIAKTKYLRAVKGRLSKRWRRVAKRLLHGPAMRMLAIVGQKCSFGYLSARCTVPQDFKVEPFGCAEAHASWTPESTLNIFHEETYIVSWICSEGEKQGVSWVEEAVGVDDNEHEEPSCKKWRYTLCELPEGGTVYVKVAATNKWGRGPWSETLTMQMHARPTKENGFTGPLGPAGEACGVGKNKGSYTWGQKQSEVSLKVPIMEDWKGKDFSVKITRDRISILYLGGKDSGAGQDILVGTFPKKIKADEIFWEIEENKAYGRHISVQLPKESKMVKWDCFVQGDKHRVIDERFVKWFDENGRDADGKWSIYED